MSKMWKWFTDRGGNVAVLVIGVAIIAGFLIGFFSGYAHLPVWRKVLTVVFFAATIGTGVAGDAVDAFVTEKESEWKGGHAKWVVAIFAFFIAAVVTATA